MSIIPNHTQIPNVLLDEWMQNLSDTELRLVLIVARQTFGWIINHETGMRKKEDWISHNQLIEKSGRSSPAISKSVQSCIDKGLIEARDKNGNILLTAEKRRRRRVYYRISISTLKSKVDEKPENLPNLTTSSTKLNDINLPNLLRNTKETITKENLQNFTNVKEKISFSHGNTDINEVSSYFLYKMQLPKEGCTQKDSRRYWNLLLKESRTGKSGVRWLIDIVAQDEFYRHNITSSKALYYKRIDLIARARGNILKKGEKFFDAEQELKSMEGNHRETGIDNL